MNKYIILILPVVILIGCSNISTYTCTEKGEDFVIKCAYHGDPVHWCRGKAAQLNLCVKDR